MPRNKLSDLNNLLFEQMERLADADSNEELEQEVARSRAMTRVAGRAIENGALALKAVSIYDHRSSQEMQLPKMLEVGEQSAQK